MRPIDGGYRVSTAQGELRARTVILATGACNRPTVPAFADAVPSDILQLATFDYRNPSELPDSGVLVVGGSATGVQLAAELRQSGRPVLLSVGEHVRLPRTYRGRDVLWWMNASGVWDQRYDEVDDLVRARRLPSPQLAGTPERTTLDLNGDGLVNQLDLNLVNGNWLGTGGTGSLAAVPEPSTALLLLLACAGWASVSLRRSR